jgi:alpha-1,3-rhamnosyltransferase
VEEAIKSVLAQDYPQLELLVIDDGSSDDSVARIRPLADAHGFDFRTQPNQGLTKTYNEALARARGDFIVFLGSDDVMLPKRITAQVAYLAKHPQTGIVGGDAEYIDNASNPLPKQPEIIASTYQLCFDDVFIQHLPNTKRIPPIATQMYRKTAIQEAGGFHPNIRLEDLYIWLKITHLGYSLDRLPLLFSRYRIHNTNTIHNHPFMVESILSIYREYNNHPAYERVCAQVIKLYFSKNFKENPKFARQLTAQLPLRYWNFKILRRFIRCIGGTFFHD